MFVEPNFKSNKSGWIEVVCGSMFSGKTEELIRRLKRARIANMEVSIFKPQIDTRYHEQKIVSHNENTVQAISVINADEIMNHAYKTDVFGIDEAQFFDANITEVCTKLAEMGKRVIVAGLDMDYLGNPFGEMPKLMAISNYVTKLHAICIKCGAIASYSYRITSDKKQVVLGEKEHYEARCRNCFNQ
jgi:thymidine kinase